MFVLAEGGVGAPAVAEFDLALSKCSSNSAHSVPLGARYSRAGRAARRPARLGLVVADDVFLEHGDIAVGGLDIEVPH
jgi:hypothetical protein